MCSRSVGRRAEVDVADFSSTYFASFGFSFLCVPSSAAFWSLDLEREQACLLTPTRAHTRLDVFLFFLAKSGRQARALCGAVLRSAFVDSVILIAVSPLRDFM